MTEAADGRWQTDAKASASFRSLPDEFVEDNAVVTAGGRFIDGVLFLTLDKRRFATTLRKVRVR
jgi:hypothetical protein